MRKAVDTAELSSERRESYVRLLRELDALNERRDALALAERRRADRLLSALVRLTAVPMPDQASMQTLAREGEKPALLAARERLLTERQGGSAGPVRR